MTPTNPDPARRAAPWPLLALLALVLAACGSSGDETSAPTPVADDAVDPATTVAATTSPEVGFAATVQPIIETNCATCHAPGGPGAFHMQIETAADVVTNASFVAAAVDSGYMPPWPASSESVPFHDDRRMDRADIEAVLAWVDAGSPLDVDPTTPIVAVRTAPALPDVDVEIGPHEPYVGDLDTIDDYRCFLYDPQLTEDSWLIGYEFVPDQTEIVHHAIAYHLPAAAMEAGLARSAEDPVGGWQCYGSSGLDLRDPLFLGWAPGQDPTVLPEGSGMRMSAGDIIVVQIHYHNELAVDPDRSTMLLDFAEDPTADLDEVSTAEYLAPAEIPCSEFEEGPLCDRDASLADARARFGGEGVQAEFVNRICGVEPSDFADMTDGRASSSCALPVYEFGELIAVFGHQHEIGSAFRMTLNPGTPDETVLLDIPVWDFDWQLVYEPVDEIVLTPGDVVQLECWWDRDLRDPELEPRWILWADGTDDEMCFATMTVRER